jgi:hypothetical protein
MIKLSFHNKGKAKEKRTKSENVVWAVDKKHF